MMEPEARRKGPRSPSEESDGMRRRVKKYDRSPSPRRTRYRRSRSRSTSRERERSSRRKEATREHEWKGNMPPTNKASNPPNSTGYPPPVMTQYNAAPPPPNTSQPPPPIQYTQGYGNYNYNYPQQQRYPDYAGYQQQQQQQQQQPPQQPPQGYRNDYPPPNWQGNVPYSQQQQQQQQAAVAAAAAAVAATMPHTDTPQQQRVVDAAAQAAAAAALMAAAGRPEDVKKQALAAELKQQKATLAKQREEYVKKTSALQHELEILRKQCEEIGKEGGRENNRIIKENQKLQVEVQNKMKSIHNVIDMLTGIIGDKLTVDDLKVKYKPESGHKRSKSPKESFSKSNTPNSDKKDEEAKPAFNFVHYDPEMHWCKTCDIFPKTAKEYLNHLHSNEHKEICLERKIVDMPWHDSKLEGAEKEVPYYPGLPTKRTPIKGLQFFSPSTAWYCKLCHAWIGDLHCASLHLKSRKHSEKYIRFVDQNPHWETDWMADREKAFSDDKHKQMQLEMQKQKDDGPTQKPKKSKKAKKNKKKTKKRKNKSSQSDSSSDSDSNDSDANNGVTVVNIDDPSRSIRVAMRNKNKGQPGHNDDDHYGNNDQVDERQMLNSLRDKMKNKQDMEGKPVGKPNEPVETWGSKEPPKNFWIKKDEDKQAVPQPVAPVQPVPTAMKPEDMPKPHMGFWTKQQVAPVKQPEKEKEKDRDDDREREHRDRYRDDRREYGNKWDRRDDKYERDYRENRYDRRRGGGREHYDSRNRRRDSNESPRHERGGRDWSPKRSYDKYKRDEDGNDDKFDKKMDKKKGGPAAQGQKKQPPQVMKGKLPFIGRLPLFKKKDDPKNPEKELAPLPYTQSKFEDTPKVPSEIILPPGVVHVPKLATPVALPNNTVKAQQMKILVAPPPPTLNEKGQPKDAKASDDVVDMEIENQIEETVIENVPTGKDDTTKPPPIPNTSRPPPGYPKKSEPTPTPFTPAGPPPPFVTNSFMQQPPPVQAMPPPYMHQMQMPPPNMYANPPPPLPPPGDMPPGVPPGMPEGHEMPEMPVERRPDGGPLPEDLQEALNIIFPADEAAREAMLQQQQDPNHESTIMYGSMYSMLGCVGYGPSTDYMDQPPPEITQQEPEQDEATGADDLRMLGIDEGDTIL